MQFPATIVFAEQFSGKVSVTTESPKDSDYNFPFASFQFMTNSMGSILTQSKVDGDYGLALWSIKNTEVAYLDLFVDTPNISIFLFLKGNASIIISGDDIRHLYPKTYSITYLPETTNKIVVDKGEFTLLMIVPPIEYLKSMAQEQLEFSNILERLNTSDREIAFLKTFKIPYTIWRIIKRLGKLNKKGAFLEFDLHRYILDMLTIYNEQYKKSLSAFAGSLTTKEKATMVKEYILANLGDINLGGLNEFSLRFYVSTKTLTQEFKVLTGKSIPQYITDERLEWAARLLDEGNLRVFEIATIIGISDTANFARKFKNKFGYPPGKRKNMNKDFDQKN